MKTKVGVALASVLLLVFVFGALPLRAQDKPADVDTETGTFTMMTPMGDLMLTLTMEQDAEHIKGILKGGPNGDTPIRRDHEVEMTWHFTWMAWMDFR